MASPAREAARWTTPARAVAILRQQWDDGRYLAGLARGEPWRPVGLALRGPTARELAESFAAGSDWAREWNRFADAVRPRPLRIETTPVGGRLVGVNPVPRRMWIDEFDQLVALLGVGAQARRFAELVEATRVGLPEAMGYLERRPMRVLELAEQWPLLLDTVTWIDRQARPGAYLRQLDVPGVDTKFVERHRGVLTDLLDLRLPAARVNDSAPRGDLAGRYGFRSKPSYIRLRAAGLPGGVSELWVRAEEFPAVAPDAAVVVLVENEISYLALPLPRHGAALWGSGYALPVEAVTGWLAERQVGYWGDIDTHGLAILNRLRHHAPHARSMLMDAETLLAHRGQWVREPSPTTAALPLLTAPEAELYRALVSDEYGEAVRLEQERVRFSRVEAALAALGRS